MKKNKSVYITPHVGGLSKESVETTDKFILNKFLKSYEKIKSYLFLSYAKIIMVISKQLKRWHISVQKMGQK